MQGEKSAHLVMAGLPVQTSADQSRDVQPSLPDYAFRAHSQASLTQNLPPTAGTSMSARQKRRRTSPEDQAILEEAYLRNSKPDKGERLEIFSRVKLGEKELQIWFQNRRQHDRRKSRPLLPHELMPHFRSTVPQLLLETSLSGNESPAESHRVSSGSDVVASSIGGQTERSSSRASSIQDLLHPPSTIESHAPMSSGLSVVEKSGSNASPPSTLASGPEAEIAQQHEEDDADAKTDGHNNSRPTNGLKRGYEEMSEDMHSRGASLPLKPKLPKQNSYVRLSIDLDGAVKVKTNDEETPSPPKQRAPASGKAVKATAGLQRSKSAVAFSNPRGEVSNGAPTGVFGRSRDARTWEFYCDGDARDALASHAENERIGSAVGAISLIRSQSQKAKAQIVADQKDAHAKKATTFNLLSKPKLSRAKSSMGRLQDAELPVLKIKDQRGPPVLIRSSSGDSDKENWAPGTTSSDHPLRRQQIGGNRRPILSSNDQRSRLGGEKYRSMLPGARRGKHTGLKIDRMTSALEDDVPALQDGEGQELDGVQALLSLSQGAWQ